MVKIKDSKTISINQVKNSIIKAYLRDKSQNLNWILGIIKGENLSKEELKEIFDELSLHYETNSRFLELQNKCKGLELL